MIKKLFNNIAILCLFLASLEAQAINSPSYSYSEMYIYDNQDLQTNQTEDPSNSTVRDPFHIINKHIFNINYLIDSAFLSPVAEIYLHAIPPRGRKHMGNFVTNIGEPINFINLLFQGKFAQARISLGRFMTNTVLGCAGIMDVATDMKLEYKGEDFGQTLGYHKVPNGPYIVVPILGPSTARDLTGKVADFFIDPFKYALHKKERNVVNAGWLVHKRAGANEVIKNIKDSLDPYETAKTLYIQNRNNQIRD